MTPRLSIRLLALETTRQLVKSSRRVPSQIHQPPRRKAIDPVNQTRTFTSPYLRRRRLPRHSLHDPGGPRRCRRIFYERSTDHIVRFFLDRLIQRVYFQRADPIPSQITPYLRFDAARIQSHDLDAERRDLKT